MRTQSFVVLSRRFLPRALLVAFLVSAFATVGVSFQSKAVVRKTESGVVRETDSGVEVRTGFSDIPEAIEPCSPEECEWWKQIRRAGHNLLKKADEKAKTEFFLLLYEGQQKAYRIPLKDRPPQLLVSGREPIRPDMAQKNHITGTVVLSVEYRADASVGDVQIVKGLGFGMDENVIQATRQSVFLPAVKNRAFVAEWHNVKMSFSDKWTKEPKGSKD
jgi:TonB family protein